MTPFQRLVLAALRELLSAAISSGHTRDSATRVAADLDRALAT